MKNKRKWNRRSYFARKNIKYKRNKNNHPVYVYSASNDLRKYLVFTHTPEKGKEDNFEKLNYNIDPNDNKDCYVKKTYEVSNKESLIKPQKNYKIHDDDREIIKKYKK